MCKNKITVKKTPILGYFSLLLFKTWCTSSSVEHYRFKKKNNVDLAMIYIHGHFRKLGQSGKEPSKILLPIKLKLDCTFFRKTSPQKVWAYSYKKVQGFSFVSIASRRGVATGGAEKELLAVISLGSRTLTSPIQPVCLFCLLVCAETDPEEVGKLGKLVCVCAMQKLLPLSLKFACKGERGRQGRQVIKSN